LPKLKKISLYQFKNHSHKEFAFEADIICISGANGKGKTNILDAIYALSYTKSYFNFKDAQLVQNGQIGMRISGHYELGEKDTSIELIIRENGKKELLLDKEEQKHLGNFIGQIPSVIIAPDDTQLITEGGELRRKFMDACISQTNKSYLEQLVKYNKILAQRNALLKNWNVAGSAERQVLEYYNKEISVLGEYIYEARVALCKEIIPLIEHYYSEIVGIKVIINVKYQSALIFNRLENLLKQFIEKDILTKRTTSGIHKDDIEILNSSGASFKEQASQGEKKTMLFALKLAMFYYLKQNLNKTPILLLDDVFEKLDASRSQYLLNIIAKENGQTFITDTHKERLVAAFNGQKVDFIDL
jgi:DNA replication and repair protein RecF